MRTVCRHLLPVFICVWLLGSVSAASAADFTWSGLGSDSEWSTAGNWQGSAAPSSGAGIGTLTFPFDADPSCGQFQCINSINDLTGVSIDHLVVGAGLSDLSGNGIALGAGGLDARPDSSIYVRLPITLTAPQIWNVAEADGYLILQSPLSGSGDLDVNGGFWLTSDAEVGDATFNDGGLVLIGDPGITARFNASNGHGVTLDGGGLTAADAAIGALHATGADISIGDAFDSSAPAGTLAAVSAGFDAASSLALHIHGIGTTAGSDYSQLRSAGPVSLGGATLELATTVDGGQCDDLPIGSTYTLITTTGSLSGTFGNAPEGAIVADSGSCSATGYRINYHESGPVQTVTATVTTSNTGVAPINQVLPVIEGEPVVGFTVFGDQGTWSGDMPQTYTLQWLRDGLPIDQPMTGSSIAHSHVVEVADQGHALTLQATARNPAGSTTVTSAPLLVPGGTPAPPPGDDRTGTPSIPPPTSPTLPIASVASVGRVAVRAGAVVVQLACSSGTSCGKVTASLSVLERLQGGRVVAISAKKHRRQATRRVVVGRSSVQLGAGQRVQLRVGLNRAGRQLLRRFGKLHATLRVGVGGRLVKREALWIRQTHE